MNFDGNHATRSSTHNKLEPTLELFNGNLDCSLAWSRSHNGILGSGPGEPGRQLKYRSQPASFGRFMIILLIAVVACFILKNPLVACQQQLISANNLLIPHLVSQEQQHDKQRDAAPENPASRLDLLEPPSRLASGQLIIQGPGIDLVALNRRRFEQDHHHDEHDLQLDEEAEQADLISRGQMIEAQIGALPQQISSRLPAGMTNQLLESFQLDPGMILPTAISQQANAAALAAGLTEDPNEEPGDQNIERLTKSCLRVQASSATADQLNVTFQLFTRRNPHAAHILLPQISRNELLTSTPFNPSKPIKWITHGFLTNLDKSEWMLAAKDKILANEDANVILTDWRHGASPALAFYPKAAANAHIVAKMIVKLLRRLKGNISLGQVHMIGHSLGAHIMGFVGSAFTEEHLIDQQQRLTGAGAAINALEAIRQLGPTNQLAANNLIGRITACDPALPCFGASSQAANGRWSPANEQPQSSLPSLTDWTPTMWTHLRPDSALLVEVLHSNPGVMGYADPLGDHDFYPNGSDQQPGCREQEQQSDDEKRKKHQQQLMATFPWHRMPPPPQPPPQVPQQHGNRVVARRQLSNQLASLGSALGRLINPLKNLVKGYTCSHHRSVELMVESLYYNDRFELSRAGGTIGDLETIASHQEVCQLVGYKCADYQSFKNGFCFSCQATDDCRSFGLTRSQLLASQQSSPVGVQLQSAQQLAIHRPTTFGGATSARMVTHSRLGSGNDRFRRAQPTFDLLRQQKFRPNHRNKYFYDTRHEAGFCMHHYHLLVNYRWLRLRESLPLDGRIRIIGSLASMELNPGDDEQFYHTKRHVFHRFKHQSYTMLVTHDGKFLGQIKSLVVYGADTLKPMLIDFIELTYMSNLDSRIRDLSSARLCRSTGASSSSISQLPINSSPVLINQQQQQRDGEDAITPVSLFVKCPNASGSTRTV